VLERRTDSSADYAWAREPARPASELRLEEHDGAIIRIRILYEQFGNRPR